MSGRGWWKVREIEHGVFVLEKLQAGRLIRRHSFVSLSVARAIAKQLNEAGR